ncbi:MAG TPA: DUF6543 domain-containing protein [Candidatus Rhabdochlamydia sp.]|nr:DUF6543 domain-containing protein [Candidatus Rhabdochlamydia sp.]
MFSGSITYRLFMIENNLEQIGFFRNSKTFSIPKELNLGGVCDYATLTDISDKTYDISEQYPSLRQTVINEIGLHEHFRDESDFFDIGKVFIKISKIIEDSPPVSIDLVSFAFCDFSFDLSLYKIEAYHESGITRVHLKKFPQFLKQMSFFSSIRETYAVELDDFWQKNLDSYRILAKFSFLCSLLQQQKIDDKALSDQSLKMISQATGLDTVNFFEVTKDMMASSYEPSHVEVSTLMLSNQASSDIFFIRDIESNRIVLYIPKYDPSFTEFDSKDKMIDWIVLQSQISSKIDDLIQHFPLSNRLNPPFQKSDLQRANENNSIITQDIFTAIASIQKNRSKADLFTVGPKACDLNKAPFPKHFLTEAAIFTTINLSIESIFQWLPSISSLSASLIRNFPDPYKTAKELIQTEIKNKWNLNIDPDKAFIRFPVQVEDLSYYGFVPLDNNMIIYEETISLVGAVLSNYHSYYSHSNTGVVAFMDPSGMAIYVDGTNLNISLKDIHNVIVDLNLNDRYLHLMAGFWEEYAKNVQSFVKYRYLQQAINEYYNGSLSKGAFELISAVGINSLIVEENSSYEIFNWDISVKKMCVGDYTATDIFLFQDGYTPLLILYIASGEKAFLEFSKVSELQDFLANKFKTRQIVLHFPIESRNLVSQKLSDVSTSTESIFFSMASLEALSKVDIFKIICENMKQQSYLDAATFTAYRQSPLLKQNEDIRFEHIKYVDSLSGGSTTLLALSFAFPILNWFAFPLFLTKSWKDIYPVVHSSSLEERYHAGIGLNFNDVELLIVVFINMRMLRASFKSHLPDKM